MKRSIVVRRGGRAVLGKVLEYYRLNHNNARNLIEAYNKYMNSLNNRNNRQAYNNAQKAAIKFTNTMFKMYEKKSSSRRSPVTNGLTNGVQKSIIYWIPGVLYRRAIRGPRRARSAPTPRRRSL